jgi:hypothetical protein
MIKRLIQQLKLANGKLQSLRTECERKDALIYQLMHNNRANSDDRQQQQTTTATTAATETPIDIRAATQLLTTQHSDDDIKAIHDVSDDDDDEEEEEEEDEQEMGDEHFLSLPKQEIYVHLCHTRLELRDMQSQLMAEHNTRVALQKENELLRRVIADSALPDDDHARSEQPLRLLSTPSSKRDRASAAVSHAPSIAALWVPDANVSECTACHRRFSLFVRKV